MDGPGLLLIGILNYGVLGAKFIAFYDATRFSAAEYRFADRMPRTAWLVVHGANIVLQFWLGGFRLAEPFGPRSITFIAGVLVLLVYALDMRPRLVQARAAGTIPE